jgi:DNA-binding XRE family transcriptional regulator
MTSMKKETTPARAKKLAPRKSAEELYNPTERKFLRRVGRRIAGLRVERDLSQVDLARKAKINRGYLGHIEIGARNPHLLSLLKLSAALKVPVNELLKVEEF